MADSGHDLRGTMMIDVQWTADGPIVVVVNAHSLILSRAELSELAVKTSIAAEQLAYDERQTACAPSGGYR